MTTPPKPKPPEPPKQTPYSTYDKILTSMTNNMVGGADLSAVINDNDDDPVNP